MDSMALIIWDSASSATRPAIMGSSFRWSSSPSTLTSIQALRGNSGLYLNEISTDLRNKTEVMMRDRARAYWLPLESLDAKANSRNLALYHIM